MSPRPAAEVERDGQAALARAIEGLAGIRTILDGMRSGALPPAFWDTVRMALADASAYREEDPDMPELSRLYDEALAAIGGTVDADTWAVPSRGLGLSAGVLSANVG